MKKAIVAYIPVLHEGYRKFFANHPDVRELYIFGEELIAGHEHLIKDIRRLSPELIKKSIDAWGMFDKVEILNAETIKKLQASKAVLVGSDDDLTRELMTNIFVGHPVEWDTIFLRWDKKTAVEPVQVSPDVKISEAEFDKKMMVLVEAQGKLAKDWWRRLGSIAVKDGKVLIKINNQYVPSDQIAYDEGDPRSNFKSGIHLESSLAMHAEAGLVAEAAKRGISLKGVDVYSEAFPCPPCAKQLAYSGIKRLFYRVGYKVLDGERILKSQGVEIVFVNSDKK